MHCITFWRAGSILIQKMGRSLLLTVLSFCLQLVFVAYGKLAWSSLLTVEVWFGIFGLQRKVGLVFSFSTVPPVWEIGFDLFAYGSPTVGKKDEPKVKRPQL